ncbi:MAG: hypothetical protein IJT77_03580 [Clostridia bacterium]|nr:hypothetical protein [Clostridia bacterium]
MNGNENKTGPFRFFKLVRGQGLIEKDSAALKRRSLMLLKEAKAALKRQGAFAGSPGDIAGFRL